MSLIAPSFSVSYIELKGHEASSPRALAFVGDLDFAIDRGVRDALETLAAPARIDLSRVRYIDARILGEFLRLAKRMAPERPSLFGVQPQVRRILEIVKVDHLFVLRDEVYDGPRLVWESHIGSC